MEGSLDNSYVNTLNYCISTITYMNALKTTRELTKDEILLYNQAVRTHQSFLAMMEAVFAGLRGKIESQ